MVIKQRAISSEEKSERRQAILDAALELLVEADYQEISISSVAKKAGVAKGTIFLYFRTKEELFLQLQIGEYKSWFNDINSRVHVLLQQNKKKGSIEKFVKIIVSSSADHPMLIRLIPILQVTLERNIDYKTALEFKRFLLNETLTTGALIERYLPFLHKQDGTRFLLDLQILLVGLIQTAHPAPLVEKVIKKEGLEVLQVKFEEKLQETLTLMLSGRKAIYRK
jgi:TetR/AcrR family transcriptional regulator